MVKPGQVAYELKFNGKTYYFTQEFYKKSDAKFNARRSRKLHGLARIVKRKHNGKTIYRVYVRRKI